MKYDVEKFKYRRIDMLEQFGILESFDVLKDTDTYTFDGVFGIDGYFHITKPVIYTSKGFIPLANKIDASGDPVMQIKDYLNTRRGTYSLGYSVQNNSNIRQVQSVTAIICVVHGVVRRDNGMYVPERTRCELYMPCNFTTDYILGRRVTSFNQGGKVFLLDALKMNVLEAIRTSSESRAKFLYDRIRL